MQGERCKTKLKNFVLIFFILASTVAFSQTREETVWSKVQALTKAIFETKDSSVLKELVSDDVTYGHSSGVIENKAMFVKNAVSSRAEYKNIQFEKLSIDVKENSAVLRHNLRAISFENGKESPVDLGILQVWRKEGGRWKLWARQAVKISGK